MDVGLERAGLSPISLCEIEKTFCETLKANQGWIHSDGKTYLGKARIINADIRELSRSDLFQGEDLDLLVGGPPCQAFSSSGKQLSVLDPRGALVSEFCRMVSELRPKMFLFENVRGLVTARDARGEPGGVISELVSILSEAGYSCRVGLLNAADFGAHQRRVRCFILGSRQGEAPEFPKPTHHRRPGLFEPRWRSLDEFLSTYADTEASNHVFPSPALEAQLRGLPEGSGIKSPGRAEATRPAGHWGYRQGTFIADRSLPARTVTGSASQDWIRWEGKLRRLTLREVKLLQGFPEDWKVLGTKAHQFKQIGNAVPSAFGEHLGRIISSHLSAFPTSAPVRIELPASLKAAMEYTKRDHERNRDSRSVHKHFGNQE